MRISFTATTFAILSLIALLLAASAWIPVFKRIGLIADAILLVVLILDYVISPKPKTVAASRQVNERLSIGRQNEVVLTISNLGARTLKCLVRDECPEKITVDTELFVADIPAASLSQFRYNLLPRRRGSYRFGHVHVRYLSRFGLFWRQVRFDLPRTIKVYSDLQGLHELSVELSRSSQQGEFHQRKRGHGTDFSSLREYTFGDPADKIDWKATARRDRPIIRTYEMEKEQRMVILLDAGRMMVSELGDLTLFDHALNSALALALTGLTYNDQVGFGIFADKPLAYLPPRRGKHHMKKLLDLCYAVEPKLVEPDYTGALAHFASLQKGRCLIVLLTDLIDATGSKSLLQGLASLSPRHLPLCVTLMDRRVRDIAESDLDFSAKNMNNTLDSMFKKAVATDLMIQRNLALSVIQRQGCLVIDAPPEELTSRLVDQYLSVKMRARL